MYASIPRPGLLAGLLTTVLALIVAPGLAAQDTWWTMSGDGLVRSGVVDPDLDAVRSASERFGDVAAAVAAGYVRDPSNLCETAEKLGRPAVLGAMGIHYFRPDLLGLTAPAGARVDGTGTHTDFLNPSILIYEPRADGTLSLVAVENLVFRQAWEDAGNSTPPSFHGVNYDLMVDDPATPVDEAHLFEPHYDLHVWLFRENPNGVFAQFNPNVTCEHHRPVASVATAHVP